MPILFDISWANLRAAMCPLQHIIGCADPEGVRRLLWFVGQHLSPENVITRLSLELAQGILRQMKDNGNLKFLDDFPWACFIRASPHSLELLQDISQVSFDPDALQYPGNSPENYHNTLQWLKTIPNPPQDVIKVWENYFIVACKIFEDVWGQPYTLHNLERQWRKWQANYEKWFPHHQGQGHNSGK
ncbi:hypothetical protein C8J57DRAFT_1513578 [Mycena rebaudengoi]|nr:hypothetical protein C8J57DRAFT_1513578 [Mycena rebaudengoi]